MKRMSDCATRKMWELGKSVGVSFQGDENVVLEKLKAMEERDYAIISSKGAGGVSL